MLITLEEAIKLNGVESWTLTPLQEIYLLRFTQRLLQRHSPEWFEESRERLQQRLEIVFKEVWF